MARSGEGDIEKVFGKIDAFAVCVYIDGGGDGGNLLIDAASSDPFFARLFPFRRLSRLHLASAATSSSSRKRHNKNAEPCRSFH